MAKLTMLCSQANLVINSHLSEYHLYPDFSDRILWVGMLRHYYQFRSCLNAGNSAEFIIRTTGNALHNSAVFRSNI